MCIVLYILIKHSKRHFDQSARNAESRIINRNPPARRMHSTLERFRIDHPNVANAKIEPFRNRTVNPQRPIFR